MKFTRLIHLLPVALFAISTNSSMADQGFKVPAETIDVGVTLGVINFEDFPSDVVTGANISFKASENFFLQYNYLQSEIPESPFEKSQSFTRLNLGEDREFIHYDLLLGYNLFYSEFFTGYNKAKLATFYLVGGVGDTDFGNEKSFSYTFGVGMQIEVLSKMILRVDHRSYFYDSSIVLGDQENFNHHSQLSTSVNYLF